MRAGVFLGRQGLVVGIAFFGLREYLITPLMVGSRLTKGYARRDDELKGTCRVPTFTERRCYNLFDSTLAAGITGACLSVFLGESELGSGLIKGGRIGRLETSRIFAGAAFIGQLALNEVGVTRVKILAWKAKADQEEEELPKPTDLFAEEDIPKLPTSIRQALEERSKSPDARRGDSPLTTRILTGMTKVLPIRKIDDLEYFASLQKRSKDLERKIAVIDAEQARLFEVAQKGQ